MKEVKVFRDPLYGYVKVKEPLIWNLIQSTEFQRLRRIHQLGGTYMVYHTAEHSRFSHSLGVYEVARRIIYEVDEIRTTLTKEERLITLCAGLLHDIGHGPYSHAFETIFDTSHEQWTIDILRGDTEVNHILESYQSGFSNKVAKIIEKECYKDDCDEELCNHHIMISIISSQLDADRLDYLQRDAYNSGATYGEIDLDRIIRSFLVYKNQIAFKYSSMHAIEDYLMSRYHMYWQVYFHPVGVSHEVLLINLFKRLKDLLKSNYAFKSDITVIKMLMNKTIDVHSYLDLDEAWILYKMKEWQKEEDPILRDLSKRILNRKLFKYISCKDEKTLEEKYEAIKHLMDKHQLDSQYYLYKGTLIKEAYQYYDEDALHNSPILLMVDGELIEIAHLSHIVKGIKDVGAKKDYKIYYPEDLKDQLNSLDRSRFNKIINK